jgi:hypothetical protein
MRQIILFIAAFLRDQLRSRASMQAEILALRHQRVSTSERARRPTALGGIQHDYGHAA